MRRIRTSARLSGNEEGDIEESRLRNASDESTTATTQPADGEYSNDNTEKRNTTRISDDNANEAKADDNFAVGNSPSKPIAASNECALQSYVETLITGRLKLDHKKKANLVENLLCPLKGPLNSKAAWARGERAARKENCHEEVGIGARSGGARPEASISPVRRSIRSAQDDARANAICAAGGFGSEIFANETGHLPSAAS